LEDDAATPEEATKVLLNVVNPLVFLMERLIRDSPLEPGHTGAGVLPEPADGAAAAKK